MILNICFTYTGQQTISLRVTNGIARNEKLVMWDGLGLLVDGAHVSQYTLHTRVHGEGTWRQETLPGTDLSFHLTNDDDSTPQHTYSVLLQAHDRRGTVVAEGMLDFVIGSSLSLPLESSNVVLCALRVSDHPPTITDRPLICSPARPRENNTTVVSPSNSSSASRTMTPSVVMSPKSPKS